MGTMLYPMDHHVLYDDFPAGWCHLQLFTRSDKALLITNGVMPGREGNKIGNQGTDLSGSYRGMETELRP